MKKALIFFFSILTYAAHAQKAYTVGDRVADVPVQKILNDSRQQTHNLGELRKDITILDFFGTWCAPCIRALPNLTALQKQFPDKLSIILLSTEEPGQLANFIKARSPFLFPVIVDMDGSFTNRFRPPSYPYTVVIDSGGKVLAITEAASLSSEKINQWLTVNQKKPEQNIDSVVTVTVEATKPAIPVETKAIIPAITAGNKNPFVELSQQFIYAAKTGNETEDLINRITRLDVDSLANGLASDNEKKAFWINLYNGFTQVRLKKDPEKYKSRGAFFTKREIMVAGKLFSLDDMEHGILRRSKIKWSLGYLNKWFPNKTEKALRVNQLDYRIHFALNCGAKSCPPIASYNATELDQQLDLATKAYLNGESTYDSAKNTVALPALMSWFRRDFGGKKRMIGLLEKCGSTPAGKDPSVSFKKYDWTLYLDNYKK